MKRLLKVSAFVFFVATLSIVAFAAMFVSVTKDAVFDAEKLYKREISCVVLDKDGVGIKPENTYERANIDDIPLKVRQAFVAIEDKRFYSHGGLDFRAILRAAAKNVARLSFAEGASTISQQLVKNTFLSGEKTIERKLKEIKLTLELEKRYEKEEILEMYLNSVYFGEGAYGISEAAYTYFGVTPGELTVAQGATLAGLLKAPSYYDPFVNPDKCRVRRDTVLSAMREEGYISDIEYNNFKNEVLILKNKINYEHSNTFYNVALSEGLRVLSLKNADDLNGFTIYTSYDPSFDGAFSYPSDYGLTCNYASIVIDNKKKSVVYYASDVGQLMRTPASSAKPWLVYAPAIEEGIITEATKINDEKTDFGGYSPQNYGDKYYGYVSVKDCLAKSLNVPSVKIANTLGIDKISAYANKMNVSFTNKDLSIALGNLSDGLTLRQLACAYTPFSSDGYFTDIPIVEKIVNARGKTVYEARKDKTKVFSPETTFIINDILKESVATGTAKKLAVFDFDVCAKTGTNGNSEGNLDAFCVAYTADHTVAVWLGNKDGKPMSNSIGGGSYPTVMAADVFEQLYKKSKPSPFSFPDGIRKVRVDRERYEKDMALYSAADDDDKSPEYFFTLNTVPPALPRLKTPVVKSYKINYKNKRIYIEVKTGENVYYYISDDKGNKLFDSRVDKKFAFEPKEYNKEYAFFLTPYLISDGKISEGKTIKLPSVKTDGKMNSEKYDRLKWWLD